MSWEPSSLGVIENFTKAPKRLQNYFVHINIERLRGALSLLQLLNEKEEVGFNITKEELREMAQEIANHQVSAARKYEEVKIEASAESLCIRIYSEALRSLMKDQKWKKIFQRFKV